VPSPGPLAGGSQGRGSWRCLSAPRAVPRLSRGEKGCPLVPSAPSSAEDARQQLIGGVVRNHLGRPTDPDQTCPLPGREGRRRLAARVLQCHESGSSGTSGRTDTQPRFPEQRSCPPRLPPIRDSDTGSRTLARTPPRHLSWS
ncbi:unnamed protein product, partial [Ixodes pacificus]